MDPLPAAPSERWAGLRGWGLSSVAPKMPEKTSVLPARRFFAGALGAWKTGSSAAGGAAEAEASSEAEAEPVAGLDAASDEASADGGAGGACTNRATELTGAPERNARASPKVTGAVSKWRRCDATLERWRKCSAVGLAGSVGSSGASL